MTFNPKANLDAAKLEGLARQKARKGLDDLNTKMVNAIKGHMPRLTKQDGLIMKGMAQAYAEGAQVKKTCDIYAFRLIQAHKWMEDALAHVQTAHASTCACPELVMVSKEAILHLQEILEGKETGDDKRRAEDRRQEGREQDGGANLN